MHGILGCLGALYGSLFEIHRLNDHEEWYCRKGFPSFNVQVVVDHKMRFRSYSIRPGSQNDKSVFNRSGFGKTLPKRLPTGMFILADAGYKLSKQVIIPYPIAIGMSEEESH